ncbi:hypothetical protein TNCV_1647491 [Trichonephila clavipes]|nr:hypothetical protein TNCV_1647491 [Trichonephila clavipes]
MSGRVAVKYPPKYEQHADEQQVQFWVTATRYTNSIKWLHRKEIKSVRPGDHGGHRIRPTYPIQWLG